MAEHEQSFEVGRSPDFILRAKTREGQVSSKVGAAWKNKGGSIAVRLDPFVVLSGQQNLVLTLFPNEGES